MRIILEVATNAFVIGTREYLTFVARIALEIVVLAQKRETHEIVIEERRPQPLGLIVTIAALLAELAAMGFVVAMAADALIAERGFKDWLNMTVDAGNRRVRAVQTKVGVASVIEDADIPVLTGMATFTFAAVVALVIIVLEVAIHALLLHDIVKRIFAMTVVATQFGVPAIEWKVGIACVIKTRIVPRAGVMAGFALLAAATLVRIVLGVTSETGHRHILMRLVGVTRRTLSLGVLAF